MNKYYKTIVAFILFLLFLSGCGREPESSLIPSENTEPAGRSINSTDCDRTFVSGSVSYALGRTEDAIYFSVPPDKNYASFLRVLDKKTGLVMPLCGIPACDHTSSSCNAYYRGEIRCLSPYGGRLFWLAWEPLGEYHICSCNPDGTGREEYVIDNNELFQNITGGLIGFFHRGYAYYYGNASVVKDGAPGMECYLVRCPIKGGAAEIVAHEPYDGAAFVVQAYKDSIFLVCTKSHLIAEHEIEHEIEIMQIDCDTLEKKRLYAGQGGFVNNMWVADDGIFLSCADATKLYYFDHELQKVIVPFEVDPEDAFLRQISFGDDRLILNQRNSDSYELLVRDFKGNMILHKSYELEFCSIVSNHFISTPRGVDQENVYCSFVPLSKEAKEMLLCFPLDGSEPEVLWSEQ